MGGEQCFVGGDDIRTRIQGHENVAARGLEATHEFHDDVGAEDERLRVGRQQVVRDARRAHGVDIAHRDADDLKSRAHPVGEFIAVLEEEGGDLCADTSAPEERDAEIAVLDHVVSNPASRRSRSARVSPRTITRALPSRTATTGGRAR